MSVRKARHSETGFELRESFKGGVKQFAFRVVDDTVRMKPAAAGASDLQEDYRRALSIMGFFHSLSA